MIWPVFTSCIAASTEAGFTWLAEPRVSAAPHFDGQRCGVGRAGSSLARPRVAAVATSIRIGATSVRMDMAGSFPQMTPHRKLHSARDRVARVVAIGASNLTRGFQTVVATARTAWGPDVQVVAALGHGRSYGADSAFLFRRLPGILQSGIWQQLESTPAVPTKALVTDVGNDIVYGFPPERDPGLGRRGADAARSRLG